MPETTTPEAESLYALIEGHDLANDRLPTPDELKKATDALAAVAECLVRPILYGCIKVASDSEPNSVTYEDIGRLVEWADLVRLFASSAIEDAEKVLIVAREALPLPAGGYVGDGAPFDERGHVHRGYTERRLRRMYGFGDEWRDDA